jgi:hypothetical protein
MIYALWLIFAPMRAWERILRAKRSLAFVLIIYLLPLLILTSFGEGWGLVTYGKVRSEVRNVPTKFTTGQATVFEAGQILLTLLVVFVGAWLVKAVGETFHGRHNYTQTFTVVAYGLSPLFLFRLLDAFPMVPPWLSWALGIIFSIRILYSGLPHVLQPDPPHAFGLFVMSSFLLFFITGLVELLTFFYLLGKFPKVEALTTALAARLPF